MQVVERSNYTVAEAITGGDGVDQLWNRRGGPTADWHACHGFVALIPFDIFCGYPTSYLSTEVQNEEMILHCLRWWIEND